MYAQMSLFSKMTTVARTRRSPSISSARSFSTSLPTELLVDIVIETIFASLETVAQIGLERTLKDEKDVDKFDDRVASEIDAVGEQVKVPLLWEENVMRVFASLSFCFREIIAGIAVKTFHVESTSSPDTFCSDQILAAHKCYFALARSLGSSSSVSMITTIESPVPFVRAYMLHSTARQLHVRYTSKLVDACSTAHSTSGEAKLLKWMKQHSDAARKVARTGGMQSGFAMRLERALSRESEELSVMMDMRNVLGMVEEVKKWSLIAEDHDGSNQKESGRTVISPKINTLNDLLTSLESSLQQILALPTPHLSGELEFWGQEIRAVLASLEALVTELTDFVVGKDLLQDQCARWKKKLPTRVSR